jgi:hypothetical protein
MKVAIRRVGIGSLAKLGCLLGAVAAFLPSLLCGALAMGLSNVVLRWLESWQQLTITVLGQEVASFDLVRFLSLEKFLEFLHSLTAASGAVVLLAILILALGSGILLALMVTLVGLVYNLLATTTGGLVVEMSSVSEFEQ